MDEIFLEREREQHDDDEDRWSWGKNWWWEEKGHVVGQLWA